MKYCAECQSEFTPSKGCANRQRFCSLRCRVRVVKRNDCVQRKNKLRSVSCKGCGATFQQRSTLQMYCNKRCIERHYKRQSKMDGQWIKALERDGRLCKLCGTDTGLVVHHLDGTGEEESPNHRLDNLVVLCRSCHMSVHRMEYRIVNGVVVIHSPLPKLVGRLPVAFEEQVVSPTLEDCMQEVGVS